MGFGIRQSEHQKTVKRLILIGHGFCLIAFLIPVLNLLLRVIHYPLLQKLSPGGWVTMNPLSAICLILLAVAIRLIARDYYGGARVRVSTSLCALVCVICLGKIVTLLIGFPFHLDKLLFSHQMYIPKQVEWDENYNSMAPNTALSLFMVGFSIILISHIHSPRLFKFAQSLNYLTILIAILSIYGYIYKIESLYSYFRLIPNSFHSAVTLIFLSSSILFLRPHKGSMALLIGENPTRIVLARFMAIFIPLLVGWFKIYGQEQGWFGVKFGTALFASCTFAISMILLGWKSNIQFKLGKVRKRYRNTMKKDRERFRRIIDLSPLNINIYDLKEDRYVFTNRASRNLFRLNDENLLNHRFSTLVEKAIHEDDAPMIMGRLDKLKKMKLGEKDDFKYRVYDKDGKLTWISSRGVVYREEKGKASQVLFNSFDITSQMKKELEVEEINKKIQAKNEELEKITGKLKSLRNQLEDKIEERTKEIKRSELRFIEFIEKNIYEGIIIYEFGELTGIDTSQPVEEQIRQMLEHGKIAEANPALARMHGYNSPDEMIGIRFTDYLNLEEESLVKVLEKLIVSDYRLKGLETAHNTKDGDTIRVRGNFIGQVEDGKLLSVWGTQIEIGAEGDLISAED